MQASTRRRLRQAVAEAKRAQRNFKFWLQTARLAHPRPSIPAAHIGWNVLHWLLRKTSEHWIFRLIRDFVLEIVGQSLGAFVAKLIPFFIAVWLAIQLGDDNGRFAAVVTVLLYSALVMLLGPPIWFINDMQEDAEQAHQVVTDGEADYSNLVAWITLSEGLLAETSNPNLPTDHFVDDFRRAIAAVTARVQRKNEAPTPPAPPSSLQRHEPHARRGLVERAHDEPSSLYREADVGES